MWSFLKISLIVAMDKKRVIGKDNDIPWRISSDWEYVKNTTKGHAIILGRKNLQSIGRALPDRRNIILTRDKNFNFKDCEIAHSIEAAFMFLPYVEKMYVTKIHHEFEGDTFFPVVNFDDWKEVSVEKGIKDEKNPYDYYFHIYERIR